MRLPLDVALVFSANPEDYTARGKIVTPLKDRIGSEIRTHYPATIEEAMAITAQEAWCEREGPELIVPAYVRETCEQIAFMARDDKRVDRRSGVSQRLPISVLENVISNAERRAVLERLQDAVPRISDIYAAMPSITGKLELEYEGEMKGADTVAREVIQAAVAKTFDRYFGSSDLKQVVQWFELGGQVTLTDNTRTRDGLKSMEKIQGLLEKTEKVGVGEGEPPNPSSRRRSSFSRDCTPTSASAAPRSASSPPARSPFARVSAKAPAKSSKARGSSAKRIAAPSISPALAKLNGVSL